MIDRRQLLLGMGGAAAGIGGLPALGASGLDLSDRDDFVTACVKMRGSLDDRLCIGWVMGRRYAVPDHKAIPMMRLMAATLTQYRRIRPDAFEAKSLEVAYFMDIDTGKLLETWKNPVTGKVVDVPRTRMGPSRFILTADGLELQVAAGEARGLELNHHFDPAVIRGDDVYITEVIGVDSEPQNGRKPFVYNEMSTYHAKMSDLADPAQATVPTNVSFNGLVTYRPWMGFADTPGHTIAHGSGGRAASIDELPRYWRELTKKYNPDVLEDPLAALAGDPE
ncbi:MAG: DUF1838 domain-containing protein [Gammaproteobacteria bacterium]|nr:DUF1838 domain-containing protein [Gammaproteobacteria bacterium]MBT8444368.1 DUF1838 domain-containing protein [Gammaproteobacteria bacterium]NND35936.1 DUF1838 family protein [Gammaproteobacteria bacterium]